MAAAADLLAVDTKVVERLSAPAENELQNVVKRKVVRHRNQPGDERADFQQYDPDGQAITTRWGGHEPTLPIPDPRPLGGLARHLLPWTRCGVLVAAHASTRSKISTKKSHKLILLDREPFSALDRTALGLAPIPEELNCGVGNWHRFPRLLGAPTSS